MDPNDVWSLFASSGAGASLSALFVALPLTSVVENRVFSGLLLAAGGFGSAVVATRTDSRFVAFGWLGASALLTGVGVFDLGQGIADVIVNAR